MTIYTGTQTPPPRVVAFGPRVVGDLWLEYGVGQVFHKNARAMTYPCPASVTKNGLHPSLSRRSVIGKVVHQLKEQNVCCAVGNVAHLDMTA